MNLEEVKSQRPECTSEDGKHTWIEFHGEVYRVCEECGYEEPIVYNVE